MSLFIPGAHIISKLVDLFCVLLFLYSIFDIYSYCRNLLTWIWLWIFIWNKFLFFTLWLSVFSASMILLVSSMWDSVCLRNEVLNGDATLLIINVHAILIPNFLSSLFHFFKHLSLPFAHMFNTLFYSMIPKNNWYYLSIWNFISRIIIVLEIKNWVAFLSKVVDSVCFSQKNNQCFGRKRKNIVSVVYIF